MTRRRLAALGLMSLAVVTAVVGLSRGSTSVEASPTVAVRGVSPDATTDNGQHKLVRASDGVLYLAFSGPVDGVEQAQVFFSLDGGQTWKPDVVLAQPGVWSDLPTLAAGEEGRVDAAWVDYVGVGHVWHASRVDGQWSEFEKISPGDTYAGFPAMVLRNGSPSLLWYAAPPDTSRDHGSAYEIFHSELIGRAWTDPVLLSSGSEDALNPALAMDANAHLHGAWFQIVQGTYGAQHAQFDGSVWEVPELVSPRDGTATGVTIEVSPDGTPHMVWEQTLGDDVGIAYSRFEGGAWTDPTMLSEAHSLDPVLTFDASGALFVLWSQQDRIVVRTHDGGWTQAEEIGDGTNPAVVGGTEVIAGWTRDSSAGPEIMVTPLTLNSVSSGSAGYWLVTGLFVAIGLLLMFGNREVSGSGGPGDGED